MKYIEYIDMDSLIHFIKEIACCFYETGDISKMEKCILNICNDLKIDVDSKKIMIKKRLNPPPNKIPIPGTVHYNWKVIKEGRHKKEIIVQCMDCKLINYANKSSFRKRKKHICIRSSINNNLSC